MPILYPNLVPKTQKLINQVVIYKNTILLFLKCKIIIQIVSNNFTPLSKSYFKFVVLLR